MAKKKDIPVENITFVCLISAPQGIEKLTKSFKGIRIVTASLDESLNEKGYIFKESLYKADFVEQNIILNFFIKKY